MACGWTVGHRAAGGCGIRDGVRCVRKARLPGAGVAGVIRARGSVVARKRSEAAEARGAAWRVKVLRGFF